MAGRASADLLQKLTAPPPQTQGYKKNIKEEKADGDNHVLPVGVPHLRERKNGTGNRQLFDPRREPKRDNSLQWNPKISAQGMAGRARLSNFGELLILLRRQIRIVIVLFEDCRDVLAFFRCIESPAGKSSAC